MRHQKRTDITELRHDYRKHLQAVHDVLWSVTHDDCLSTSDVVVFSALLGEDYPYFWRVTFSLSELAKGIGLNARTVMKSIRRLKDNKYI